MDGLKGKRALVTGGNGYIGKNVVKKLRDAGVVVDILDFQAGRDLDISVDIIRHDSLVQQSIIRDIQESKQGFDFVVHLASFIVAPESVEHPMKYYTNNLLSTISILNIMRKFNINNLIFASSACVYGQPESEDPLNESSKLCPTTPYGRTKLMIEDMIKDWAQAYNKSYTIFRFFNVAGANVEHRLGNDIKNPTHLIPNVIKAALKNEIVSVFGSDYNTPDGTAIRDYIHVEDIADAHLMAMKVMSNTKDFKEIINLGSGKGFSVKEIIDKTSDISGFPVPYDMKARREGDCDSVVCSYDKALLLLGFKPKRSIEHILKDSITFELTKFGEWL